MLIRNLKYGVRFLIRSKGFSCAVVATLSACIGVNVAIFAIVHSVLLRPLPVPDSENLVLMSNRYPKAGVGSTNSGIVKLVLREGLVLVAAGLILGIAGSVSLRSVVQNEIYGVAPLDPLVLGCVAILLAVVALAACIVPARRAMQVDPASC
jgi:FtsX-like permease family protein